MSFGTSGVNINYVISIFEACMKNNNMTGPFNCYPDPGTYSSYGCGVAKVNMEDLDGLTSCCKDIVMPMFRMKSSTIVNRSYDLLYECKVVDDTTTPLLLSCLVVSVVGLAVIMGVIFYQHRRSS